MLQPWIGTDEAAWLMWVRLISNAGGSVWLLGCADRRDGTLRWFTDVSDPHRCGLAVQNLGGEMHKKSLTGSGQAFIVFERFVRI